MFNKVFNPPCLPCIGKSAAENFVDAWKKQYVNNLKHLLNDIDFRLLQGVVNMSEIMGGSYGAFI